MKESSKIKRKRRRSRLGLAASESGRDDAEEKETDPSGKNWAEELVNSSGISDSSATLSESSSEESNGDQDSKSHAKKGKRKSVRFKNKVYKNYLAVDDESDSEGRV